MNKSVFTELLKRAAWKAALILLGGVLGGEAGFFWALYLALDGDGQAILAFYYCIPVGGALGMLIGLVISRAFPLPRIFRRK